ncbi:hypothetical protein BGZ60DRAFT_436074 [Tricladium varicosporioides]|nr:hypothetical protein BGZ60DRAFT_436074 [Hymenoscyphus varicosporioides]
MEKFVKIIFLRQLASADIFKVHLKPQPDSDDFNMDESWFSISRTASTIIRPENPSSDIDCLGPHGFEVLCQLQLAVAGERSLTKDAVIFMFCKSTWYLSTVQGGLASGCSRSYLSMIFAKFDIVCRKVNERRKRRERCRSYLEPKPIRVPTRDFRDVVMIFSPLPTFIAVVK